MSKKKIVIIGSFLVTVLALLIATRIGFLTDLTKLKGDMSWTENDSMFLTGPEVNIKMKKLAGATGNVSYTAQNTNITSIRRSNQITDNHKTDSNKVSMQLGKPIYMWFDNGTIYYYTEAENVFFHADSERFFFRLKGLTSLDISSIKTHQVTNMIEMFSECSSLESFNVSASNFNTERVTTMASMFSGDSKLTNLDLNYFNTSNVEDMSGMFYGCSSLVQLHIEAFNTSKVTDMYNMFSNCTILERLDLSNFDTSNVTDMSCMFYDCNSLIYLNISSFDTSKVEDMVYMFVRCYGLTELDLSHFSSNSLTDTHGMFYASKNLKNIIFGPNFTLSKVEDMSIMFEHCKSLLTLSLDYFSPVKATNMQGLFGYCDNLERITFGPNFNTSSVVNMSEMFNQCEKLMRIDLSSFDTSNVEDMSDMFYYCSSLSSIDVSSFNTSKVTNMSSMFLGCGSVKVLNLSSFNTSNVTNMSGMFNMSGNLTTIYVSNLFTIDNVTSDGYMFNSDLSLVGGNGTTYSSDNQNKSYARIDTESTPGYFTLYSNQDLITITFDQGEGTIDEPNRTIEKWFQIGELPSATAPTNKIFGGWYTSPSFGMENKVFDNTIFTEDTTLYSRYVDVTEPITITFDPVGGTFNNPGKATNTVTIGSLIVLPTANDVSNPYGELKGWYTSTNYTQRVYDGTPILDEATYYAKWEPYIRTVTFDPNGGELSESRRTKQVTAGTKVESLPSPTREYYVFAGWFKDQDFVEQITSDTIIENDITFYAKWDGPYEYHIITLDTNGGYLPEQNRTKRVIDGGTVEGLYVPTKENYTFIGWYHDLTFLDRVYSNEIVTSDVTYYAKWESTIENPLCKRATTSQLHKSGDTTYGKAATSDYLTLGDAFICDINGDGTYDSVNEMFYYVSDYFDTNSKITNPEFATLIYSKVTSENNSYLSDLSSSAELTFLNGLPTTEEWSNVTLKDQYRIVYDYELNGRLYATYQGTVNYTGKAARMITFEELKGCFAGDSVPTHFDERCNFLIEDVDSYYPLWLETIDVDATETNNGLVITSTKNVKTQKLSYSGAIKPVIDVNKANMNLANQNKYYRIIFDSQGGTFTNPEDETLNIVAGELVSLPEVTREGYTFGGWYTSTNYTSEVYNNLPALNSATYYAKWISDNPELKYTITFDPGEGELSIDDRTREITAGSAIGTLPTPTREGNYLFNGWYTSTDCETSVSASTIINESVTLYARWIPYIPYYTVTFDPGEGELSIDDKTRKVTPGSAIGILPIPVRGEDYTFDGWYTSTEYETLVTASTIINSSTTFYAKWTPVGGGEPKEISIVDTEHVTIDGNNIRIMIPTYTKLEKNQLLSMITIPGEYTLKDKNNNEITAINQGVGTESTLSFSGTTYTLTVYGDVNGDGRLDGQDIFLIYSSHMKARHIGGASELNEIEQIAANINQDSNIDLMDIIAIYQRMKDSDESGN